MDSQVFKRITPVGAPLVEPAVVFRSLREERPTFGTQGFKSSIPLRVQNYRPVSKRLALPTVGPRLRRWRATLALLDADDFEAALPSGRLARERWYRAQFIRRRLWRSGILERRRARGRSRRPLRSRPGPLRAGPARRSGRRGYSGLLELGFAPPAPIRGADGPLADHAM